MELDIKNRIEKQFGCEAKEAIKLLELFEERNKLSPRVSRSIVKLSNGNIDELVLKIKEAEDDWRDIVEDAESETFELNKPFDDK
jgi:hypothetical protein